MVKPLQRNADEGRLHALQQRAERALHLLLVFIVVKEPNPSFDTMTPQVSAEIEDAAGGFSQACAQQKDACWLGGCASILLTQVDANLR